MHKAFIRKQLRQSVLVLKKLAQYYICSYTELNIVPNDSKRKMCLFLVNSLKSDLWPVYKVNRLLYRY